MSDRFPAATPRTHQTLRRHLILTASLVTLGFGAIVAASVFVPIALQLGQTSLDSEAAYGLAEHFLYLHGAFWPLIAIAMLGSIVTGQLLYHRMRAPLVRFIRCFDEIAAGRIPDPIVIRANDYLTIEADALNQMLVALNRRQESIRQAALRLEELCDELALQGPARLSELQEIAKQLSPSPATPLAATEAGAPHASDSA
jgi:methyl-accepting chemotaxis protein